MLKISRIRPCEYNNSCSIFHNESYKIGLAFFWIFYDFLRILQVSAKAVTLFKKQLTRRSLELLIPHKSTIGSRFGPCRNLGARNWVPGRQPAAAGTGRARAGNDPRALGVDSCAWLGQGEAWWGGAPAASGGGRRDCGTGDGGSMHRTRDGWWARVGAREGGGEFDLVCSRPDLELAAAAFNGVGGGSAACAR
jgi:hypothetical protein